MGIRQIISEQLENCRPVYEVSIRGNAWLVKAIISLHDIRAESSLYPVEVNEVTGLPDPVAWQGVKESAVWAARDMLLYKIAGIYTSLKTDELADSLIAAPKSS